MIAAIGLVLAPVADFKTLSKSAYLCTRNSSRIPHEIDQPFSDLALPESGSAVQCVDLTVRLFLRTVTRLLSADEALTIVVASSWAIYAKSRLVAANTADADVSLLKSRKASRIPANN
jgi:hypothetical protein